MQGARSGGGQQSRFQFSHGAARDTGLPSHPPSTPTIHNQRSFDVGSPVSFGIRSPEDVYHAYSPPPYTSAGLPPTYNN